MEYCRNFNLDYKKSFKSDHLKTVKHLERSRNRPKTAPYLTLKNSKRTSKCQSIPFCSIQKTFAHTRKKSHNAEKMKGDPLGNFFLVKSRNAEYNWEGDPLSRPVLYVTRETFLVQCPGPTGAM